MIEPKEYFDKEYDNNHINTVVDLKDLDSLYGLMQEYAKEQLRLHVVSHGTELLPDFLYKNSLGGTLIGYHGDTEVSEEWQDYLKKLGNCG